MKKIITLLCALAAFGSSQAEELKLIQRVEVSISAPESKVKNYSKTMLLNQPVQFDIDAYRFNIKSQQIEQTDKAMVEAKVSKKDEKGEYQVLSSPSIVVLFRKQAQFKTEDGEVSINFKTIVENQKVANQ